MKCPHCKKNKPRKSFNRNKAQSNGYQGYCKPCMKLKIAEWQKKDPERARKSFARRFQKFYTSIHGRAVHMLNTTRQHAKLKGLSCALTIKWLEKRLQKGICESTGLPFALGDRIRGCGCWSNGFAPSIDRINPKGNYSPKNCRMTLWMLNRARGAFPQADFDLMVENYRKETRKRR